MSTLGIDLSAQSILNLFITSYNHIFLLTLFYKKHIFKKLLFNNSYYISFGGNKDEDNISRQRGSFGRSGFNGRRKSP